MTVHGEIVDVPIPGIGNDDPETVSTDRIFIYLTCSDLSACYVFLWWRRRGEESRGLERLAPHQRRSRLDAVLRRHQLRRPHPDRRIAENLANDRHRQIFPLSKQNRSGPILRRFLRVHFLVASSGG